MPLQFGAELRIFPLLSPKKRAEVKAASQPLNELIGPLGDQMKARYTRGLSRDRIEIRSLKERPFRWTLKNRPYMIDLNFNYIQRKGESVPDFIARIASVYRPTVSFPSLTPPLIVYGR